MDAEEMMDKDEEEAEEMMDKDEEEMDESEDKDEMEDKDEKEMDEMEDKDEDEKMDEMEDKEEEDKDELDLESVLAELEKDLEDEDSMDEEYNTDEVGDGMNKDEVETDEDKLAENDVSSETGKGDNKVNAAANDSSKIGQGPESEGSETVDDLTEVEDKDEEDLDLDEVLKALTEEDKEEEDAEENEKLKSEIKEHRKVINFMRKQLNEVNLMNAKLLFSNKLFRAFGLNNNQKLKVVENFDRTTNLREVKLVYATLAESFKKPSRISESVKKGSSSKPTRSTKPVKEVLSEGAELKARFKKLANIL